MSFEVETLAQFFGANDRNAAPNTGGLSKAKVLGAARNLPAALKGDAAEALVDTGRQLLNNPIADVFAEAWKTRRDLRRYRDTKAFPPDVVHEYALVTHDISLKRTPKAELVVNGTPTGAIVEFELKLALEIGAAHLRIQNAHIIGARVGEFRGSGTFSCGSFKLFERKTATFRLPGTLNLASPIQIR